MLIRLTVLPSVLLAAILGLACDDARPSAPSPIAPIGPPAPPPPAADFSAIVGMWKLTVRMTDVSGSGCVADTMRSQIGDPMPYTLSITPKGSGVSVTLHNAPNDRACTFTPVADSGGFTTYNKGGFYDCTEWSRLFRCSDGTVHDIVSMGEDISGRVSGNEMTGTWDASWVEGLAGPDIEMKTQFTGTR